MEIIRAIFGSEMGIMKGHISWDLFAVGAGKTYPHTEISTMSMPKVFFYLSLMIFARAGNMTAGFSHEG
jgi:hypothetical protein